MTGLEAYLTGQATDARILEVEEAALSGRPLTSEECDVIRGMVLRLVGTSPSPIPQRVLDDIEDALEEAIDEIESLSSYRLERALDRVRKMKASGVAA
jgi:hypothetical protein